MTAAVALRETLPPKTREAQYQACLDDMQAHGRATLGLMTGHGWRNDPIRLLFTLARYKFVARMLDGTRSVAEIGCGDGFGSRIVRQFVGELVGYDFDALFVEEFNRYRDDPLFPMRAFHYDILSGPLERRYDAIFAIDVFEHILPQARLLQHLQSSVADHGKLILGIPSIESQLHASLLSRAGHVNCKSGKEFQDCLDRKSVV